MSVAPRREPTARVSERGPIALIVPRRSGLRVSSGGFWRLACANRDLRLERAASGRLIVMAPAGSGSGRRNAKVAVRLGIWAEADGTGVCFDSSAGFTLPNGAVRSPDASWIIRDRWEAVPADDRERFASICPDFVVELVSPSDSPAVVRRKLVEYIEQGARLGWLIDPIRGTAEVYRPGRVVEVLDRPASLGGEDVLPGFVLDLREILSAPRPPEATPWPEA